MAIATNTVTLADYAMMSNSPLVQKVTYSLILYSNILQDIPMITKKSFIINGVRFDGTSLPSINWSQLNAEPLTTKATPVPYQEQAFLLRNSIDVDKYLVEEENQIVDPRGVQVEAYLKALTYDMNFKFINNNHVTGDANAPVGIRARIDDAGGANKWGVRSENKITGSAVDLSQANATQATANKFIELLDQLLWSVDAPDGDGVVLYMNDTMKRRINFLLRLMGTSGGLAITQDQFNRVITMYKGATIHDLGYKADQTTRIISSTEDTSGNDASSTYTSIYAVNYSEGHLMGWQFGPPNVQDLGLINNGVIYRTLVDYAAGYCNVSTRSLGRLYDLKIA
jgi:hypothetical protein